MGGSSEARRWADGLVGRAIAGRYRVDGVIGAGGMGAIVAATQLALRREVALKLILPHLGKNPTYGERFQREARAAASVGGAGVVAVLDFDVDPELGPFLVMERLRGRTLSDRLQAGPIPTARTLEVVASMLDTLARVHERGLVHRDIKPPNVFLAEDELGRTQVKLLDFGISRLAGAISQLTAPGMMLGTPRYMAPEQAEGNPIDARTDLYAVGLVLYACLAHRRPYDDTPSDQVIHALLRGSPPPLAELAPSLPGRLLGVVDKAIARDPAYRFQDASSFAATLREVAAESGLSVAGEGATLTPRPTESTASASLDSTVAPGVREPTAPASPAPTDATPLARPTPGAVGEVPPTRSYDAVSAAPPTSPATERKRRWPRVLAVLAALIACSLSCCVGAGWLFTPSSAWDEDDPDAPAAQLGVRERIGRFEVTYGRGETWTRNGRGYTVLVPVTVRNPGAQPVGLAKGAFTALSYLPTSRNDGPELPAFSMLEPGEEISGHLAWGSIWSLSPHDPPTGITVELRGVRRRIPVTTRAPPE